MGTYQMFSAGGQTIGSMSTKPSVVPVPFWLYYFNIDDIDAALERIKAGGGRILEGPLELRGGGWIARCADPQGAIFALTGMRSNKVFGYFKPVVRDPSAARFLSQKRPRRQCGRLIVRLNGRFCAAAKRKLTDRALDVEFDPRHLREQIDIRAANRTAAEPHISRHQVKRLHQYADVLQNKRIGDRAVLP